MGFLRSAALSAGALCALLASAIWADEPTAGEQPAHQVAARLEVSAPVRMQYLLYLPQDYEMQEKWPLVLFLHGAGERGDDLNLVKVHGPPKLVAAGKQFPFILVSPQCPKDRWWNTFELTALLDEICRTHKVDADRICVTGLSMGGFGTWSLAAYTPRRFAAIAPICGGGEVYWAKTLAPIPTWIFHGAKDPAIPLQRSESMVTALTREGGHPKLTIYPEAQHDSWTVSYENPALYEWLLAQRRPQPAAK